jgi:hypothetical protein
MGVAMPTAGVSNTAVSGPTEPAPSPAGVVPPSRLTQAAPGSAGFRPTPQAIAGAPGRTSPTTVPQATTGNPTVVSPVTVKVPHPLIGRPGGGARDPTFVTKDGRRWIGPEDLAQVLRDGGNRTVSAADLVAFNADKVHRLGGRQVFEVGQSIQVLPGAAAVARAAGNDIKVQAGISAVAGGSVGPAGVYLLTPLANGKLQFGDTKIFYTIPGTKLVGTFKPKDMSMGTGVGTSAKFGSIVLFGNVRMEVGGEPIPGSVNTPTGFSVNGGILFPLMGRPGLMGGVAGQVSVMGEADWTMIMDVWRQTSGF